MYMPEEGHRLPLGRGPSLNTWPRWAPERASTTSTRGMNGMLLSVISSTCSGSTGSQKLGHPVKGIRVVKSDDLISLGTELSVTIFSCDHTQHSGSITGHHSCGPLCQIAVVITQVTSSVVFKTSLTTNTAGRCGVSTDS